MRKKPQQAGLFAEPVITRLSDVAPASARPGRDAADPEPVYVELPPARSKGKTAVIITAVPPGSSVRVKVPHCGDMLIRRGQCSFCRQPRLVAVRLTGRRAMPEIRTCVICARELEAVLWHAGQVEQAARRG